VRFGEVSIELEPSFLSQPGQDCVVVIDPQPQDMPSDTDRPSPALRFCPVKELFLDVPVAGPDLGIAERGSVLGVNHRKDLAGFLDQEPSDSLEVSFMVVRSHGRGQRHPKSVILNPCVWWARRHRAERPLRRGTGRASVASCNYAWLI